MTNTLDTTVRAKSARPGLRRILGVSFGLAVIVGSTLGVGILRTPGLVAAQLPNYSAILAVWVVGGLYTLLGSVCLTELGTMLPQAGGYYVYARRAFGETAGFAVGWTDWLTYCAVLGYVSIGMSEFVALLAPSLGGAVTLVAVVLLLAFVGLQWMGVRVSSRFQEVATALKSVAFLALVAVCFAVTPRPASSSGTTTVLSSGPTLVGLVVALQSVLITYGGWQSALYFTEEDRDPARNLPRSMIGGEISVIVIYLLVNLALLAVLPVASLAGSTLAAADAAQIILGVRGAQAITLLSVISLPPSLNAMMMIGTRILFAMGRDGLVWSRTATVNTRGTPGVATLVTTAVTIVLIVTGTFGRLVAMASFFLAANYAICCLALVVLRRREPALARPFRAWGYPWSAGIVLAGAAVFLIGVLAGDTINGVAALALLGIGLVGRRALA